jgi:Domain of unknown function (DUF4351)
MAYPQVFLDWEAATQQRWQEIGERRGLQLGERRGAQANALTIALRLLHRRIGTLDDALEALVGKLATTQLEDLSEAVLDFSSVEDINRWLQEHPAIV